MARDLTEGTGAPPPAGTGRRPGGIRLAVRAAADLLPDWWDLHVYGGGGLIAYGLWMTWPPAGPVVVGALLLYLGLAWSPTRRATPEKKEN